MPARRRASGAEAVTSSTRRLVPRRFEDPGVTRKRATASGAPVPVTVLAIALAAAAVAAIAAAYGAAGFA
jgi:hypothetical protein